MLAAGVPNKLRLVWERDSLHRQPCHSVKDVASLASASGVLDPALPAVRYDTYYSEKAIFARRYY
jgi:hypothetical protein